MDSGIFTCVARNVGESEKYTGQALASGGEMLVGALFGGKLAGYKGGVCRGESSGPEGGNAHSGAIAPTTAQEKTRGFTCGQAHRVGSIAGNHENRDGQV